MLRAPLHRLCVRRCGAQECMLGQGTVGGFFTKLRTAQDKCPNFSVPRIARESLAFTIEHYAGPVTCARRGAACDALVLPAAAG